MNLVLKYFHWKIKPLWDASALLLDLYFQFVLSNSFVNETLEWNLISFLTAGTTNRSVIRIQTIFDGSILKNRSFAKSCVCLPDLLRCDSTTQKMKIYYSKLLFLGWAHLIAFLLPFFCFLLLWPSSPIVILQAFLFRSNNSQWDLGIIRREWTRMMFYRHEDLENRPHNRQNGGRTSAQNCDLRESFMNNSQHFTGF